MFQSAFIVTMRNIFPPELGDLKYVVYVHDKVKLFSMPLSEYVHIKKAIVALNTIKGEPQE